MDQPFFSIIIPTFNAAGLVGNALDSILIQGFTDLEIVVMDGGSIDATMEIVNGKKDNRIKIYSRKDYGIYDAMNHGVRVSSGRWLYFLGADDTLYNESVLQKVYLAVGQSNPDVIYGNVLSERFHGIYDGEFTVEKLFDHNICHQAIFIQRKLFSIVGNFDLQYKRHADWDHNIRWFLNPGVKTTFIAETVAVYADGGYSSGGVDESFFHDKAQKFLQYGRAILKREFKRSLYISVALQKKREHRYLAYFLLKFRIWALA